MAYDASRFKDYFEHEFTYDAGFRRNVGRFGRQVAIVDPAAGREWTYAELDAAVDKVSAVLLELGVKAGDRVAYQLYNGVEFAFLYLATQRIGAVGVPMNFRLAAGETAIILADSTPAVFIFDDAVAVDALAAVKTSGSAAALLTVAGGGNGAGAASGVRTLAEAMAAAPDGPQRRTGQPSSYGETTRLYTSGTTGRPKGVSLPSIVEVMSAHDVIMHFPLTPHDRTLNMTPWFHRGGLYSGGPNPLFYVGGSVVPMRTFDPAAALDWVEKYGITFLVGAPVTAGMLADEQERRPRDLSGLRGIVTMGAPLERAAVLRYQKLLTPRIFNGYGTTEAFWNTFLRPEDLPEHAGTAGRACTDDDVAIVKVFPDRRAEPEELAARDNTEQGEIIMRTPKSGFSYANLPQVNEEKFVHNWLYSGDLGTWDEDGFITIVGRKDDMIISGGENIHPVQVEEVLNSHPGVHDSVVVGLPDGRWGQRVVAYVIPQDAGLTADELERHCLASPELSNFKRPRAYAFVTEVPQTATGKKIHYQLARQAEADAAAGLFQKPAKAAGQGAGSGEGQ
ncbi:class I adenylate-forming enzyme family protein [Arthrobacter sp. SDTb3-6]|uniref:class I adenylate-forming enzyme family protein n=1 Tax=Arthrobacter sp. SDTb3-6 TaxID=2713571 RepID=UPI00159D5950|nr:AMP-binding protein [Arthrobacter sp. SDTb3-6]NVM99501.1 AMP-binding protein [Arthrobacter sp. SDTb3-6]